MMTIGVYLGLFSIAVGVSGTDYCSLTCQDEQHTMCRYPPEGGESCRGYRGGLSEEDANQIVAFHNMLRQEEVKRETRPPAANMMQLEWDDELAMIAQRWADQCDAEGHDNCRISRDGSQVGQSVAIYDDVKINRSEAIYNMMVEWYYQDDSLELEDEFTSLIDMFCDDCQERFGYYTQMIWANTRKVGCGLLDTIDKEGRYKVKLVCNYKPAGNIKNMPVYKQGIPCSACPPGTTCGTQGIGLCVPL